MGALIYIEKNQIIIYNIIMDKHTKERNSQNSIIETVSLKGGGGSLTAYSKVGKAFRLLHHAIFS